MADTQVREAERRWLETGALEDHASYLRERLRAGSLTPDRLELAAYCGHAAARVCLDLPLQLDPPHDGRTLARDLCMWGHETLLRGAVLAVSLNKDLVEDRVPKLALSDFLERTRWWLDCPSSEALDDVRRSRDEFRLLGDQLVAAMDFEAAAFARFARSIAEVVVSSPERSPDPFVEQVEWWMDRRLSACLAGLASWALHPDGSAPGIPDVRD